MRRRCRSAARRLRSRSIRMPAAASNRTQHRCHRLVEAVGDNQQDAELIGKLNPRTGWSSLKREHRNDGWRSAIFERPAVLEDLADAESHLLSRWRAAR